MAEGKGIPWKGKAAQRGGSEAATGGAPPVRKSPAAAPAPSAGPVAPPAHAVPSPTAVPTPPAAGPAAGGGGKAIPWKGKAQARAAATPAAPAAPAAPTAPARATASGVARPTGLPPIVGAFTERWPEITAELRHGYAEVALAGEQLPAALQMAKLQHNFDYLSAITAVDWEDRLELLYHLYSYSPERNPHALVLRVSLPREENPLVPSATAIYPGAEFQEREIFDLMGIKFVGHPDLRRILLADDFPGHPLRKDYQIDYGYVVVHHLRAGAEGQVDPIYVPPHQVRPLPPSGSIGGQPILPVGTNGKSAE